MSILPLALALASRNKGSKGKGKGTNKKGKSRRIKKLVCYITVWGQIFILKPNFTMTIQLLKVTTFVTGKINLYAKPSFDSVPYFDTLSPSTKFLLTQKEDKRRKAESGNKGQKWANASKTKGQNQTSLLQTPPLALSLFAVAKKQRFGVLWVQKEKVSSLWPIVPATLDKPTKQSFVLVTQQIWRPSKKKKMLKQINKARNTIINTNQKTKVQSTKPRNIVLTKPMHSHLQTSLRQRYVQKTSKRQNIINPFINTPKYKNDPYFYASGKTQSRSKFIQLLKKMIDSQMHLGHLVKRTHPSMRKYIYTIINKFAIFDLVYTAHQLNRSLTYLTKAVLQRKTVLFIANKQHLKNYICSAALLSKFYFVNAKWRGGLITNWEDMSSSLIKLTHFELSVEKGGLKYLPKKEISYLTKRTEKLYGHLKGLRKLVKLQKTQTKEKQKLPGVVIIFGQRENRTALREIQKKSLRNILIVDTNGDSKQGDDFVIPSNDRSISSVGFFLNSFLTAIDQGRKRRLSRMLIKKLVITTAQVSKANQFWRFYLQTRSKIFISNKATFEQFQDKYKSIITLSKKLQQFDQTCFYLLKMFMFLLSKKSPYPIQLSESILTRLKKFKPKRKVKKSKIFHQSKQTLNQSKQISNHSVAALPPFEQSTKFLKSPTFTSISNQKVKTKPLAFKPILCPKSGNFKQLSNSNPGQIKSQKLNQTQNRFKKNNQPSKKHDCCSINNQFYWKPQRRFVQVDRFYKINYNNLPGTYKDFVTLYKAIKIIKKSTRSCLTSLIPLVTQEKISSDKFTFNLMAFSTYCHKILNIKRAGRFLKKPTQWDNLPHYQKKRGQRWQRYLISKGLKPGQKLQKGSTTKHQRYKKPVPKTPTLNGSQPKGPTRKTPVKKIPILKPKKSSTNT